MAPRIVTLRPKLKAAEFRTVLPPKKAKDAEISNEAHRKWRREVLRRAGYKCEKCGASGNTNRLIADHIVERRDGGALTDLRNGMALCDPCHTRKTAAARARRIHDHTKVDE